MRDLYHRAPGHHTRWSSFENPTGGNGLAAKENQGEKGHAFDALRAGQTIPLMEVRGPGIVNRIWMTFNEFHRSDIQRLLVLRCNWDGQERPAVEVPLGDFACLGSMPRAFECELVTTAEGRSYNLYFPMPFRTGARITLTNDSAEDLVHLFYDVDFTALDVEDPSALYFHAYWKRDLRTSLDRDHEVLPLVVGRGRFLGLAMVVNANFRHTMWWGEGEFKAWLDGDSEHPTLCGTGAEDYAGSAWGLGAFTERYQGCTHADSDRRRWAFYRFHIPDPIWFDQDCRITFQTVGGGMGAEVREHFNRGAAIRPISTDDASTPGGFRGRAGSSYDGEDASQDVVWMNFRREDDIASTAFFYLDCPSVLLPRVLPQLPPPEVRTYGFVPDVGAMERKDIG
jgi:hypothetical protein